MIRCTQECKEAVSNGGPGTWPTDCGMHDVLGKHQYDTALYPGSRREKVKTAHNTAHRALQRTSGRIVVKVNTGGATKYDS